ncbi:MAG: alpha/beta hydrolase [Hyphomicrobiales bacterium]|nr:alpha/beta hydrolase [Hyphomicrobiales bacterium]
MPETRTAGNGAWRDRTFRTFDGLQIHYRDYAAEIRERTPLLCLPGLSRSTQDFHDLAVHFSTHKHRPRRVVVMDYRGRGLSEHDSNAANYRIDIEMNDMLHLTTVAGIEHAGIVGTSRGGMIAMLAAAARPSLIKATVLNDVGPVIEVAGLLRIKQIVASEVAPVTWNDAIDRVRLTGTPQYPLFTDEDWEKLARMTYRDEGGRPVRNFDPKLYETIAHLNMDTVLPPLWAQFDALGRVPAMVIRGEHSDILSKETVKAMAQRMPTLEVVEAADQGHAPLLCFQKLLQKVSAFFNTHLD